MYYAVTCDTFDGKKAEEIRFVNKSVPLKDLKKETIALQEANKLGIPVIAIADTNANPDMIDYPIPGNDDAMRAIHMYCDLVSGAVLDGLQAELTASGVDIGASAELPEEAIPELDEGVDLAEADADAPAQPEAVPAAE